MYEVVDLGTSQISQKYDSKCPHYSLPGREKTAGHQPMHMLPTCGSQRDTVCLQSKTFIPFFGVFLRQDSYLSDHYRKRKYLPVPII